MGMGVVALKVECDLEPKNGAREWNRTITVFLPGDFKSPASTNFATRAFLMSLFS